MTRRRVARCPEVWLLTALSAVLHAWRLFTPREVVFDEIYYERFAGFYLTGVHFFDVHPPLGRLMFTGFAWLIGVPVRALTLPVSTAELRVLPAAFGTLLVPLVFLLLRQLGTSRRVAALGAIAVLLDNALLVMSRYILPDIFLIVFGLASISAWLAARTRSGWHRWAYVALSAVLGGCALSVKWTGASGIGVVLALWLYDAIAGKALEHRDVLVRRVRELAVLVVVPAAIYASLWAVHFALLTHSGPGDIFMPGIFQAQMPGNAAYNPAARHLSFWEKFTEVHHAIRYGNGYLQNVTHPSASPWYTWPIMKHPIGLAESAHAGDGSRSMVILLGNPVVWWWALLASGLGVVLFVRKRERFAGREVAFFLLVGAALLNYVPFMAIKRLMYLYHYLFALVVLIALGAFSSGIAAGWMADDDDRWSFPSRRSGAIYVALVAAMIVGFVYFAPFTYGLRLSAASYDMRFRVLHPF